MEPTAPPEGATAPYKMSTAVSVSITSRMSERPNLVFMLLNDIWIRLTSAIDSDFGNTVIQRLFKTAKSQNPFDMMDLDYTSQLYTITTTLFEALDWPHICTLSVYKLKGVSDCGFYAPFASNVAPVTLLAILLQPRTFLKFCKAVNKGLYIVIITLHIICH